MQEPQEEFDPFARAIPGQSLTNTPKSNPYERPPMTANPEEVLDVLEESLLNLSTREEIGDLLEVGISCESISECLVQKCFTEGMCSADVSELVKPGVFMMVAQIGNDEGIEDIILFNGREKDTKLSSEEKLELMEKLSPEKFSRLEQNQKQEEIDIERFMVDEDDEDEDEFEIDENFEEENTAGSFLDMDEPVEPVIEEEEEEEMEVA
tara:strand:- start:32 stop:658 length:627 start_codon:yes stop_codon:yes gene_type:complete